MGKIRKEHPALKNGSFAFVHHNAHSFAYLRQWENDRILVVANMGDEPIQLPLQGEWKDLLSGNSHRRRIAVASQDFAVLSRG